MEIRSMNQNTTRIHRVGYNLALWLPVAAATLVVGCGGGSPGENGQPAANTSAAIAPDGGDTVSPMPVDLFPPILHLPLDDSDASPVLRELSTAGLDQVLRTPDGEPETANHSVPGIVGSAIAFRDTGTSLAVPAAQLGGVFDGGSDFSVSFWWRSARGAFPDGYRAILSNYASDQGGVILYQRGSADGRFNRIYMNFYAAGSASPLLSPSINVPEDEDRWHHFVFQREGATLRAWRDGRLLASHTDPAASGPMGAGVDLRVGAPRDGVKGALDELRLYPRALAPSEIGGLASREQGKDDLFLMAERLHELKADPKSEAGDIALVKRSLDEALARQEGYPKPIGDHLELLAFRYRFVDGDDYEMAFAFRAERRLAGDYFFHVRGWVDPAHAHLLPDSDGGAQRSQKWEFTPSPPAAAWTPGEVVVVRSWVKAEEVPYRISLNLLDRKRDNAPLARKYVELSWHASL